MPLSEANMHERMATAAIAMLLFAILWIQHPVWAEPQPPATDEIHTLLEKSLSVVEIDKEILRIQEQKQMLTLAMAETEQQLTLQEQQISSKQEQAGNILRAYYMGDRDFLFTALFSSKSLSQLFQIVDYIELILANDKHTLTTYRDQYSHMQEGYTKLEAKETELAALEQSLLTQKERVIQLEKQLAQQLAGRSDEERIRLLIQELTSFWEDAGLTKVKQYFHALSQAMQKLPDWVQNNKHLLEIKGFQYTLRVPEDELNIFLREQNELFNHFSFTFSDGIITAYGKKDDVEISVSGHYSVEDEPVNGIIFHVDQLLFNGFALPDTTRQALEEEFDLGFYPQLIISFLKASAIEMNDGELVIQLSIKL